MADADVLASILDDCRRRGVPFVLSQEGRVRAYALPPDYDLVRYTSERPSGAAELKDVLQWDEPEQPS